MLGCHMHCHLLPVNASLWSNVLVLLYAGESGMDSLLRRFDISTKAGARVTSSDSAITIIAMTGKQDTSRGIFELQYSWVFEGMRDSFWYYMHV